MISNKYPIVRSTVANFLGDSFLADSVPNTSKQQTTRLLQRFNQYVMLSLTRCRLQELGVHHTAKENELFA